MNVNAIKKAPKWAWFVTFGVVGGVVIIKVFKGRAVDTSSDTTDATTVDQGSVATTSPSPVITPPVIVGSNQDGDNGALADLVSAFTGTFSSSLDNAVNTIGNLASGDQALAGQAIGIVGDQSQGILDLTGSVTQMIANAGSAPAPAAQNPTPIIVSIPAPTPVSTPAPAAQCPAAFPHSSAQGCYKCERQKDGTYLHVHQSGSRVGGNKTC